VRAVLPSPVEFFFSTTGDSKLGKHYSQLKWFMFE
jgi:hypothetical protein